MGDRWTGPLHRLDVPLYVIWGNQDPIAVYDIALKLRERNASAWLETLDGVGHYPQLEAPDQLAASLRAAWSGAVPTAGLIT